MKLKMGLFVLMLVVGIVGAEAQRGGGGGGRGGGGMGGGRGGNPEMMEKMRDQMEALRAFPVGEMWSALSLGMDLPEDKLKALRVIMTDTWKKRQEWLAHAAEHGSWKEVKEELQDLKKRVDKQVKAILDKDQQKALKNLLKQSERINRSGRR
jgi:hypothetical protein